MPRRPLSLEELVAGVRGGRRATLARAITLVESTRAEDMRRTQALLQGLSEHAPGAPTLRVGITGVPGVGKSTFIEAMGLRLCEAGHRVAVLAVDPSSSVRGGSILGDKTRMTELSRHPNAYIRPSPTGGALGGVNRRTRETIRVVEAAGFDVVLVETVGVGQSETRVSEMVDTFLVLMLAGAGDELQGIKKGILEVADILAIHKADGDNLVAARKARGRYASALRVVRPAGTRWRARVKVCSSLTGEGLDELWQTVLAHRAALGPTLVERRREQDLKWAWALVEGELLGRLRRSPAVQRDRVAIESQIRAGQLPPTLAAWRLLEAFDRAQDLVTQRELRDSEN